MPYGISEMFNNANALLQNDNSYFEIQVLCFMRIQLYHRDVE